MKGVVNHRRGVDLLRSLPFVDGEAVGDTLHARARITKNYEHKGHKWVEADVLVLANDVKPVIRATHIAIYRPRQLAEAA